MAQTVEHNVLAGGNVWLKTVEHMAQTVNIMFVEVGIYGSKCETCSW